MNKPYGIVLLGANGSGKSTLGRELANKLDFAHFDVEDYWFYKTDTPYTAIRPGEERNEMLLSDMRKHGSFIVSGDVSGWGDVFLNMFDLAVFLKAPADIRMKRIENREYARWGDRVHEGGDMVESQRIFREFAATRDVGLLEQAVLKYQCPVVYFDGTNDCHETAGSIAECFLSCTGSVAVWYHGSPLELTELAAGSTITRWKELAIAFSHKPSALEYDHVGDVIKHNGIMNGYLYIIDEPVTEHIDIYGHPNTSMDARVEWLTKRPFTLKKIGIIYAGRDIVYRKATVDDIVQSISIDPLHRSKKIDRSVRHDE